MITEMSINPAAPKLDGPVKAGSKGNSHETSVSFKKSLEDAAVTNLASGEQAKTDEDMANQLNKVLKILSGWLNDKTVPDKVKNDVKQLLGFVKTMKADINEGKSKDIPQLLQSFSKVQTMVHKDGALLDDHIQKLLDDFKKKMGTDMLPFFQSVVQTIMTPKGVEKVSPETQQITKSLKHIDAKKSEPANREPIQKSKPSVNANTQQVDSKAKVVDLKKVTIKSQITKEQTVPKNAEPSPQTNSNKTGVTHWVTGGPVHKIQQFLIHADQKPTSPGVQILQQVREVISKGIIKPLPAGGLELTVKLHPANLGTVQVVLTQNDAGLQAVITAQNGSTKDLLQSQLTQLKQSFAAIGINVQKIDVGQFNPAGQTPSQFSGQAFQQSGGDGRSDQGHSDQDSQHSDADYFNIEPETSFEEWLREGGIIP